MYLISLDLETTWLDARFDGIIEVGIVKYDLDSGEIIDTYSSLCNPWMIIPEEVTIVTGITNEEVSKAPFFSDILRNIRDFIWEDSIIIWHNVEFDLNFLRLNLLDLYQHKIFDTFKLAQILYLKEKSLNLGYLCEALEIWFTWAHRAINDAKATWELFFKILEEIKNLGKEKKDILKFAGLIGWKNFFITQILEILNIIWKEVYIDDIEKIIIEKNNTFEENFLFYDEKCEFSYLDKQEKLRETNKYLEKREEQEKMMKIVNTSLHKNQLALVEAPTWIGKTFAYLIPSIIFSVKTGEQIFVSTNTKTLQDQIYFKDMKQIENIFTSLDPEFKFSYSKVKWRRNYISLLLFFEFAKKDFFEEFEIIFIAKILFWLLETETGELDELSFYGKEFGIQRQINAFDKRTLFADNPYLKSEPLYKARTKAKKSNVVIINHSLLINEFNEDWRKILPPIKRLVIDEWHNLGQAATDSLKKMARVDWIVNLFETLENTIKQENKKNKLEFSFDKDLADSIILGFWMIFDFIFRDYFLQKNENKNREILVTNDLAKFNPAKYRDILNILSSLEDKINMFAHTFTILDEENRQKFEKPLDELVEYLEILQTIFADPKWEYIKVVGDNQDEWVYLYTTKLNVWSFLKEQIWNKVDSLILTSATFEINDCFDYFHDFFNLEDFEFYKLKSDFDYPKQMTVYVPSDLWDLRNLWERDFINNFVTDVFKTTLGKTLCLMTSFSSIKEVFTRASLELQKFSVQILAQNMTGWKHKMIESFKANSDNSIILWTDSFWEWVDLPGEDLEYLVIYKLPFWVPTDPVFMARGNLFKDNFRDFAIPSMVVKLKQWVGRLIRTKKDRWVVIMLDKRINSSWGREYIKWAFPAGVEIKTIASSEIIEDLRKFKETI